MKPPPRLGDSSAPTVECWDSDTVSEQFELLAWLRDACAAYTFSLHGVYQEGLHPNWPLIASNEAELRQQLEDRGSLLPLPKEPAALANVLEVSIADYLINQANQIEACAVVRGTERGYPDLEFSGPAFGGGIHAVDIKVARKGVTATGAASSNTQSRITLYTGNTYFKHPDLEWEGGILRPFADYASHLDVVVLYWFDPEITSRARDIELYVHPSWRIGSTKRSSTTREYIGGVTNLDALRNGAGEFETEAEFYKYWRAFKFKTPDALNQQVKRLSARRDQA